MKTRVMITGNKGFIGSHLMPRLKQDKYWVAHSVDIVEGKNIFDDIIDYSIHQANVVIHLAAKTDIKESFNDEKEYYKTNILGTARILEKCLRYNTKLIYISSASVKDELSSPYAMSKYIIEEMMSLFIDKMDITVLRLENVYGDGMKKGTLLYNYLHNKELIVDGDGQQTRDYIHVDDVVDVIIKAIENNWSGEFIPVGSGISLTVREIAEFVHNLTGKPIKFEYRNSIGLKKSFADIDLLKSLYPDFLKHNLYTWIKEEYDRSK